MYIMCTITKTRPYKEIDKAVWVDFFKTGMGRTSIEEQAMGLKLHV